MTATEYGLLVEEHLELAIGMAKKFRVRTAVFDRDDARSCAYFGLVQAARRYEAGAAKFSTFAHRRMKGEMVDEVRRLGRAVASSSLEEMSEESGSLELGVRDEGAEAELRGIDRQYVWEMVRKLTRVEAEIVTRLHVLEDRPTAVARAMGKSPSRISQINKRALTRLREMLAEVSETAA